MRLLITGTRHGHPDVREALDTWLAKHGVPELVVLGDARGVDKQARDWCVERGLTYIVLIADWAKHGRAAGPRRNAEMVALCKPGDHCCGFPCPDPETLSTGTLNCMTLAHKAGLVVTVYP